MNETLLNDLAVQVTGCSELVDFDPDDGGNADAVVALYGDEFLYLKEIGWFHWNGKYWKKDDAALLRAVEHTFIERGKQAINCKKYDVASATKRNNFRLQGVIAILEARLRASIDDFDNTPELLNVDNGVLNLRTGALEPHEPSQRFTYCVPVPYDKDADSSQWRGFLNGVLTKEGEEIPNYELIEFLQRFIGYAFTGYTRERKILYGHGPTGAGKGTLTETLLAVLPYPLGMEVDFNTLTEKRKGDNQNFDLADLKPARVVIASESNKYQSLNPAKIKHLTGGNWIRCAHKQKEFFSYQPQFTPILISNHDVNSDPDDNALWGRVLVVEFPNSFQDREDTELKQRLVEPDALKGVLAWVVQGALRYFTHGLIVPESVRQATKEHRDKLDTIQQFLDDRAVFNDGLYEPAKNLYQAYVAWCKDYGVEPKGMRMLGDSLTRKGFTNDKPVKIEGKTTRVWWGLKLVPEECKVDD